MNHRLVPALLTRSRISSHGRIALALLALCTTASCKKREQVNPVPPGLLDENGQPRQAEAVKPAEPPAPAPTPEPPTVYDFEQQRPSDPSALSAKLPPSGLAPGQALDPTPAEDAGGPPRDLEGELNSALSPASNCLDVAQAAAQPDGRLTVSVTAFVQGSGRVSRTTVTAPGQPASAVACIEKQVLAIALQAPIPSAPVQVKGTLQLQIRSAARDSGLTPGSPATPIRPQPMNPDIARPEPGDVAGPP